MAQTIQHISPDAPFAVLVTFSWGSPKKEAKYIRWSDEITVGSDTFIPVTSLSAKPDQAFEGGTNPDQIEIKIPTRLPPVNSLILPYKHAVVKVTVEEISPGTGSSRKILFFGTVDKARLRARRKLVTLKCSSLRSKLGIVKLGMQCLTRCPSNYGEGYCKADKASQTLQGAVASGDSSGIDGSPTRCRISLADSPNIANSRFAHGYLEHDDLRIDIRQVADEGTNPDPSAKVDLEYIMPPSWEGQTISIVPGCDGDIESCRDPFRNQESEFLGLGYRMNPYNAGLEREA